MEFPDPYEDVIRTIDAVSSDDEEDLDVSSIEETKAFNEKFADKQKELTKQCYIPNITESIQRLALSVCPQLPPGQPYALVSILCKPYDQKQDAFSMMVIGTYATVEEADAFMTHLVEKCNWRKFPLYIVKCGGFFSLPPPPPGSWPEEQKRFFGEKAKEVFGTLKQQTNDASKHIQARLQEGRNVQDKRTKKAKKLLRRIHKMPSVKDMLPEGYLQHCKCIDVPFVTGHQLKQWLETVDPTIEYDSNGVIHNVYPAIASSETELKVIYNQKLIAALDQLEKAGRPNPFKTKSSEEKKN